VRKSGGGGEVKKKRKGPENMSKLPCIFVVGITAVKLGHKEKKKSVKFERGSGIKERYWIVF